jgi:hypothetical protein
MLVAVQVLFFGKLQDVSLKPNSTGLIRRLRW